MFGQNAQRTGRNANADETSTEPTTSVPSGWAYWEHFPWLYSETQGAWFYLKAYGSQIYAYNYTTEEWQAMPE